MKKLTIKVIQTGLNVVAYRSSQIFPRRVFTFTARYVVLVEHESGPDEKG